MNIAVNGMSRPLSAHVNKSQYIGTPAKVAKQVENKAFRASRPNIHEIYERHRAEKLPLADRKTNFSDNSVIKPSHPLPNRVLSDQFMVVTQHNLASEAGAEMLRKGGTATDAMVAALAALNVVTPEATGIGGGGFLVAYDKKKEKVFTLDGRETAPEAANPDMFVKKDGSVTDPFAAANGGKAVATPGLLKMLKEAHDRGGKLPWKDLFEPAIHIAEKGFPMSKRLHYMLKDRRGYAHLSPGTARYFRSDGSLKGIGETVKNPELAQTFRTIANEGILPFYTGEIAKDIVNTVSASPVASMTLSLKDLANYKVKERSPVSTVYNGEKYYSMAAPSSGGLSTMQALKLLEPHKLSEKDPSDIKTDHLIFNAERLAYADRNVYIADPDFVKVPEEQLLSAPYLKKRGAQITGEKPIDKVEAGKITLETPVAKAQKDPEKEPPSTSHMSIIDSAGNAISMTSSVEYSFGSGLETKGGFLLNNSMTDFDLNPVLDGEPAANRIEPGKRPRSSMAPFMGFTADNKLKLVTGSPGGAYIIGFMLPRIIANSDWATEPDRAAATVNALALDAKPKVLIEKEFENSEKARQYQAAGYEVKGFNRQSGISTVESYNGLHVGVADPRREGSAVGE